MNNLETKEDIITYLKEEVRVAENLTVGDTFFSLFDEEKHPVTKTSLATSLIITEYLENMLIPTLEGKTEWQRSNNKN